MDLPYYSCLKDIRVSPVGTKSTRLTNLELSSHQNTKIVQQAAWLIDDAGGQTALSFAHHLLNKSVRQKSVAHTTG
jgi:hypothetical protein